MRADVIEGRVVRVLDPDTLDVEVLSQRRGNRLTYAAEERVRVSSYRGAGLATTRRGNAVLPALEGARVRVHVYARDPRNMVFGDLERLPDAVASRRLSP